MQLIRPWALRAGLEASLASVETIEAVVCKDGVKCSWGVYSLEFKEV